MIMVNGAHVAVPAFGHRKPLLSSLTRQLRNPNVLTHIANPSFSLDGILRDDGDGSNTRQHPLVNLYPDTLRIRLYYDDLQLADAIGSYSRKVGRLRIKKRERDEE